MDKRNTSEAKKFSTNIAHTIVHHLGLNYMRLI